MDSICPCWGMIVCRATASSMASGVRDRVADVQGWRPAVGEYVTGPTTAGPYDVRASKPNSVAAEASLVTSTKYGAPRPGVAFTWLTSCASAVRQQPPFGVEQLPKPASVARSLVPNQYTTGRFPSTFTYACSLK